MRYAVMARDERFLLLRRRFARLALAVAGSFLGWYFLYVALSAFARDLMARPVAGNINVALVLGVLQFVSTFALAWYYARYASESLDPIAAALREEADAPAAIRAAPRRSELRSPAVEDDPTPERRTRPAPASAEEPVAFADEPAHPAQPEKEFEEGTLPEPEGGPENVPGPPGDPAEEIAEPAVPPAGDEAAPAPGLTKTAPATSANGTDRVPDAPSAKQAPDVNGAERASEVNGADPVPSANGVKPTSGANGAEAAPSANGAEPAPSANGARAVPGSARKQNGKPGPVPSPAKPKDDGPDAWSGTGARPDPGWLR
ncbi:DUF485 domain-containing protein [Actinomadura oligospora]|uniref:DUF485 domain-containing protein n=1 Tax=Actinomadura oligospora TaxID=111804 RepID=UPI0004AC91C6|nr:DUF485 domain-containing protein [Actinomadura oligospora]